MATRFHNAHLVLAGLLLLALPSAAQITIGSDISLTSNGTINAGYNDTYGNQIASSHGLGFGGNAALNGFFYNPNFLSFNLNPYYNQSRSNANVASISDASGVSLSSAIFSGSHFPGAVNYSTAFNSTGNYGIPGITSLNTNGNTQSFGVNWGEFLPGLPSLSVGYQMGNSNYYLYGTNENGSSNFNSFNINSNYNIAGFGLGAGVSHGTSDALIPGVIIGGQTSTSNSDSTTYVLSAGHQLPWNGNFTANFNRTDLNADYLGYRFNGDIDIVSATMGLHPTPKLSFSLGASYTDNLSGSLYEAIVPGASGSGLNSTTSGVGTLQNQSSTTTGSTGIVEVPQSATEQTSHALNFLFSTNYSFAKDLQAQGFFERRQQTYFGENVGSNLYSGGLIYTRQIAGGYMGASGNITDSTLDGSSENQLGFNVSTNYSRRVGQWYVAGYFNYAQNVQTLLVTYNTSVYSFSADVSRRIGRWYWTGIASAGRSGLTAQPGSSTSTQTFGTTFGMNKFGFGANYSKSDGNSLAGGGGLVPTPLPPIIPANLLVLYGGTSYSVSFSTSPTRRLNASLNYVKARNDLNNLGITSWNNYEQENAYVQYQFRQIGINGGYTHLVQGFSASGTAPASVSSVYIGVYRWFNFF